MRPCKDVDKPRHELLPYCEGMDQPDRANETYMMVSYWGR